MFYTDDMKKITYTSKTDFVNPNMPWDFHWWTSGHTTYHCHEDYYEIFITTTDNIVQIYNGQVSTLPSNSLILIRPNQYHQIYYTTEGPNTPSHFNIQLKIDYLLSLVDYICPTFKPFLESGDNLISTKLNDTAFEYIKQLANSVTLVSLSPNNIEHQNIKLLIFNIILILSNNHQFAIQNHPNNSNRNYALELKEKLDNYEYIQKNMSDIYELFPLSPTTLIKNFRELTGMTIVRYATLKKIEYIKSLLIYTRYSILQISSLAGYDSLSYMISTFKKEVGVTPSVFRKNHL